MKEKYLGLILLIERLHRRFLDVVKTKLDSLGIEDINNIQTLILYNIGPATLSVGELTVRGYYLGSNVSYNIKKMTESGYLDQERSEHDKRSVKVCVSEKGRELIARIDDLIEDNIVHFEQYNIDDNVLMQTLDQLNRVEDFWSDMVVVKPKFG